MGQYPLDLPAERVWAFVKERADDDFANFHANGKKTHRGTGDAARAGNAVVAEATMDVEPLVERNYWILRISARRELSAPRSAGEVDGPVMEISLEEFDSEFMEPPESEKRVCYVADSDAARRAFEAWIAPLRNTSSRGGRRRRTPWRRRSGG